jgi:hypothetical protein
LPSIAATKTLGRPFTDSSQAFDVSSQASRRVPLLLYL